MTARVKLLLALIALAVFVVSSAAYTVGEWEQTVITQFGRPVRQVNEAGLHFKIPFMQKVRRFDKRILNWDGYPNQIPTKDKKYILVDTTARWRIARRCGLIQLGPKLPWLGWGVVGITAALIPAAGFVAKAGSSLEVPWGLLSGFGIPLLWLLGLTTATLILYIVYVGFWLAYFAFAASQFYRGSRAWSAVKAVCVAVASQGLTILAIFAFSYLLSKLDF